MHRFFIIIILTTAFCTSALARSDTSMQGNAVPLFDNLQSDNVEISQEGQQLLQNESKSETGAAIRALERYYNAGKYPEALRMADFLKDKKLSHSETEQYLRYTIASYKEMSYDREADSVMMLFTKKYPFYLPQSFDPIAFQDVFDNYSVIPRLSLYFNIILHMKTNVKVDSIFPRADTSKIIPTYDSDRSYGITLGAKFGFTKKFAASLGAGYMVASFNRIEDYGATKFYYHESDAFLTVPVLFYYDMFKWKSPLNGVIISFECFGGASADFVFESDYQAYTWFGDNAQYTISDKTADLNEKVRFNYSTLLGFRGTTFESKRISLYFEGSWHFMMRPLNDSQHRYNNSDLVFNHLYVPDAVHLGYAQIKIGCKFNIFYKTVPKYGYGYKN